MFYLIYTISNVLRRLWLCRAFIRTLKGLVLGVVLSAKTCLLLPDCPCITLTGVQLNSLLIYKILQYSSAITPLDTFLLFLRWNWFLVFLFVSWNTSILWCHWRGDILRWKGACHWYILHYLHCSMCEVNWNILVSVLSMHCLPLINIEVVYHLFWIYSYLDT